MTKLYQKKPIIRNKWLLIPAALLVGLIVTAGVFMMLEWRPEQVAPTRIHPPDSDDPIDKPSSLTLISWNIGYAGLGRDADFFMDGGRQVRPVEKSLVEKNLVSIQDAIRSFSADVILLQEVDSGSSRSFGIDQVDLITDTLAGWSYTRALNFKVPWIPAPLLKPLGRVESGLLTLSRYPISGAVRHQLPGSHPWPVRIFHLKRCVHQLHIPAPDGADWIMLHVHLSVFDKEGSMRRQQMEYLKDLMTRLHAQGHHVVVAGDWNQALPGIRADSFEHQAQTPEWFRQVPEDWTPDGWQWAFDSKVASLRATNKPYIPRENFTTVVDGFLLSPRLRLVSVKTQDLGFIHTDHHPVRLEVSLPVQTIDP